MSEDKEFFICNALENDQRTVLDICKEIYKEIGPLLEKKFELSEKREPLWVQFLRSAEKCSIVKFIIRLNPFYENNESYTKEEAEKFWKTIVKENIRVPDNCEAETSVVIWHRSQNEKNEVYSFIINFKEKTKRYSYEDAPDGAVWIIGEEGKVCGIMGDDKPKRNIDPKIKDMVDKRLRAIKIPMKNQNE